MRLIIRVKAAGPSEFRRAGIVFTKKPLTYDLTDEQAEIVLADQMLICEKPKKAKSE